MNDMPNLPQLDRRAFLTAAGAIGGGIALSWLLPGVATAGWPAVNGGRELGVWVVINPDDTTLVRIARSEMGQGSSTGLAQLVAEELDADWSKVQVEFVPPHVNFANQRAWGDMSTGGSRGIRASVDYVRKGGAAARAMLVQAAAQRWNVPASELVTNKGVVSHAASGRQARYGELVEAAASVPVPTDVTVKAPKDWKLVGQGVKRLDTADKLTGKQQYGIDVQLPNMLYAAIIQCPVFGGKLVRFDADKIKTMPGVRNVVAVDDNAVAVVADGWWQARKAVEALPITWDEGPNAKISSASIAAYQATGLDAAEAGIGQAHGDVKNAMAGAAKTIEAVYGAPFLNHATLEPMNCTALVQNGSVEVWVGTQNGEGALNAAAAAAGVPAANVKVNKFLLGGGFGRRGEQDYTRQAVKIAAQVPGRPVKLIWTREEDMRHGYYRPVTQCKMTGALDKEGNVTGLHVRIAGQSIMAFIAPARLGSGVDRMQFQGLLEEEFGYMAIPNLLIDQAIRNTHVPVGFWRGVNHNQNAVYVESFIDELAHAAGKDPYAFRRTLMVKNPKHLAVLDAVAAKAEWSKPLPAGVYRGISQNGGFGSYTAAVAEVSVSPKGELKVHRIVAGIDCGHAVNPAQIAAQAEGSFVYGLSAALYGEITIKDGRVAEGNFDDYPVMRLAEMPKVETIVMASGGFWGGVGEPTIAVAAPAVLNAIFAATGKRVRTLPLTHHDLSKA